MRVKERLRSSVCARVRARAPRSPPSRTPLLVFARAYESSLYVVLSRRGSIHGLTEIEKEGDSECGAEKGREKTGRERQIREERGSKDADKMMVVVVVVMLVEEKARGKL